MSNTLKSEFESFGISNRKEYNKIIFDTKRIIRGKKGRLQKDFRSQSKFALCVYCRYKCDTDNAVMQKIWSKTNKITQNMCDRLILYEKILQDKYTTRINKKGNRVVFMDKEKIIYSIKI
jgi:hypothetical protein